MSGIEPKVGIGATELLYTDTVAHVVTRVSTSGKRIWVRRVNVDTVNRTVTNPGEPFPCIIEEGLLDKPFGPEKMLTLCKNGRWMRNGIKFIIGQSYSKIDYRF